MTSVKLFATGLMLLLVAIPGHAVNDDFADQTAQTTININGRQYVRLDITDMSVGDHELVLSIDEDREVELTEVDYPTFVLGDTDPDDEDPPPPPDTAYADALTAVRKNFTDIGEEDTFDKQRAVLFAVLVPGTADTGGVLWEQTQVILQKDEVLNGNAPQWEPWLSILTEKMEVPDLTVEQFESRLAEAKASLGEEE